MAAKGIVTANGQVTNDADLDSALSMLPILRDQGNVVTTVRNARSTSTATPTSPPSLPPSPPPQPSPPPSPPLSPLLSLPPPTHHQHGHHRCPSPPLRPVNPYGGIKYDFEWVVAWWGDTGEEYFSTQGGRNPL